MVKKMKQSRFGLRHITSQASCFLAQLLQRKAIRSFVLLGTSTGMGQLISIVSSPVLTRLYTPEDLGAQSVFIAMLSQALILSCLRYEWAIVLPSSKDDALALVIACFVLSALISCSIAVISLIFRQQLLEMLNISNEMSVLLLLLAPTVFISGCYQTLRYWHIRQKTFALLSQTKVVQSLSSTGAQIGLGFLSFGSMGLIIGTALNNSVGAGKLAVDFVRKEKVNIDFTTIWKKVFSNLAKYSSFPKISVWSSFLNSASLNAPIFFLSYFYGMEMVGTFALAQKLINIPVTLVGGSIFQIFLSQISSIHQKDPRKAKKIYVRWLSVLTGFSLVGGVIFWAGSYHFGEIFGSEWEDAGLITRCLTPSLFASLIVSPISILDWLGRQSWMLIWNVSRIVLMTIVFHLSNSFQVDAIHTITVFSLFMATMYFTLLFLNLKALHLNIEKQYIT